MSTPLERIWSLAGIPALLAIAWILSTNRRRMPWRTVAWGIGLQGILGIAILKTPYGRAVFGSLGDAVGHLLRFSNEGAKFVFGAYVEREFTFALQVLPIIIFVSALMALLYHLGILQRAILALAWVMQRTLRTSGPETLSSAANVFMGQTEAPLLIRPYLPKMSRSELATVMVGGFATIAGSVLAAYVGMLSPHFPGVASHLLTASVLNAPASLVIAKILYPPSGQEEAALHLDAPRPDSNAIGALTRGAIDGMRVAATVAAMIIALLALVAMLNALLGLPAEWHNASTYNAFLAQQPSLAEHPSLAEACQHPADVRAMRACAKGFDLSLWEPLSLQAILGFLFWPLAFVIGVNPSECATVAGLLGERTVMNEFIAYLHLSELLANDAISPRAAMICTYALCGFANVASVGVQVGGIGMLAPNRRDELAQLGLRAMAGGTLASFTTACLAGVLN